ncbi:hypothetical protein SmJEL517_g02573 [Synchytrium microbalum]|uniref:protein-serine/threonine phosphatase n=1 Tax=Synchytrium microbalum TaxID=1806994 RepID=A0A507CA16_9FUNG|nr:uncharacterized protein SmJEL517_g02573 [Synchytrium microbalum]TPX34836.1 hypothetical protein SmJEL517_g02573 [Synchytrium microbalum]
MGQTLSEPIVDKETESAEDTRYAWGSSSMQGWRISMEDAHTTLLRLTTPSHIPSPPTQPPTVAFFAVYDGHGGAAVAQYAGSQLHNRIASDPAFIAGNFEESIRSGYLGIDVDLRADKAFVNDPSGCTAVCAILTDDGKVICGNAGDSRAVLSVKGVAEPMSYDHKPVNPEESRRIVAAGGFVEFGRVNGNLALSRAIGDFDFKQSPQLPAEDQIVTVNPEIITRQMTEDDEFLVLACDGIWDCMSNQDVVDFVRVRIATTRGNLGSICEQIMDRCLASDSELGGVGCDNMTVIIVAILRGKSLTEWADAIKKDIEVKTGKTVQEVEEEQTRQPPE